LPEQKIPPERSGGIFVWVVRRQRAAGHSAGGDDRLFHAQGSHVGLQDGFFFHALVGILLAQADDGADGLGVVAFYPCIFL